MNSLFTKTDDVRKLLKSRIFVSHHNKPYVFDDDSYAMMDGDFRMLIHRGNIVMKNLSARHKYSLFQYETNFVFRTYENEMYLGANEFIISIGQNEDNSFTITFLSLESKNVVLILS